MRPWESDNYYSLGQEKGIPQEFLEEALFRAHEVQSEGRSAVLTLGHLAKQTDVPYTYLRHIVSRTGVVPYSVGKIRKKTGGVRNLLIPDEQLKRVHRWINDNILQPSAGRVHPSSVAYMRGQSILTAASRHCGARWMVKVDIKDFFDSVSEARVYWVFRHLGYHSLVAFEMARICTVGPRLRPIRSVMEIPDGVEHPWDFPLDDSWGEFDLDPSIESISIADPETTCLLGDSESLPENVSVSDAGSTVRDVPPPAAPPYRAARMGHLPQGAPTSPALSNLAMRNLDQAMFTLASTLGFIYTRYSDDMLFSSSGKNDRTRCADLSRESCALLQRFGFKPNYQKVKIFSPGSRKMAYGLVVNSSRPRLPREVRTGLENEVYKAVKYGIAKRTSASQAKSVAYLLSRLFGWLQYAHLVEPDFADPLISKLRSTVGEIPR